MSLSDREFRELQQKYLREKEARETHKKLEGTIAGLKSLPANERLIILEALKPKATQPTKTCGCLDPDCGGGCDGWPTRDGMSWIG